MCGFDIWKKKMKGSLKRKKVRVLINGRKYKGRKSVL